MRRRSRTERVLTWISAIVCALIILAWHHSTHWDTGYGGRFLFVGLAHGCLVLDYFPIPLAEACPGGVGWRSWVRDFVRTRWIPSFSWEHESPQGVGWILNVPLWMPLVMMAIPTILLLSRNRQQFVTRRTTWSAWLLKWTGLLICMELLIADLTMGLFLGRPILLVLSPALAVLSSLLWYRERPFPRGHCRQCGYDLTGNVSGRCPECGEVIGPDGEATDANG